MDDSLSLHPLRVADVSHILINCFHVRSPRTIVPPNRSIYCENGVLSIPCFVLFYHPCGSCARLGGDNEFSGATYATSPPIFQFTLEDLPSSSHNLENEVVIS